MHVPMHIRATTAIPPTTLPATTPTDTLLWFWIVSVDEVEGVAGLEDVALLDGVALLAGLLTCIAAVSNVFVKDFG
jgi:hypothetical protein